MKSCVTKPEKVCENSLRFQAPQNYPYSFPLFQKYHNHPIFFSFFHHLLRLISLLLSKKVVGTRFFLIQIKNYVQERKPIMIQIRLLKKMTKKEVKGNSNSVPYRRFQCLMTDGRFQCLVALQKFQRLVANGRIRRRIKKNILFTFSYFPPNKFYLNLFSH